MKKFEKNDTRVPSLSLFFGESTVSVYTSDRAASLSALQSASSENCSSRRFSSTEVVPCGAGWQCVGGKEKQRNVR